MGACGMLIGVGIIAAKGCCSEPQTNEDRPLMSYDFFIKKDEKKDGLDVYKPKSIIRSNDEIRCPLCKCEMPNEDKTIIQNKIKSGGERYLFDIINKYNREVDANMKLADINALENIYNEIQRFCTFIGPNRYFKHTCTRNNICRRATNQDICIDLYCNSSKNCYEEYLKIDIRKLKSDENYRNNYIKNKEIAYEKYIKHVRKIQIENEYRADFEEYTFNEEKYNYDNITSFIKYKYNYQLSLKQGEFGYDPKSPNLNATSLFVQNVGSFKYTGTQKRFKFFLQNLTGQRIDIIERNHIILRDYELNRFHEYILQREPEYSELIDL
jgi:hypothetical protein